VMKVKISGNPLIPGGEQVFDVEILSGPVPPIPPPSGQDMIDLSQAGVYWSPADIASWPITLGITGIQMAPASGFAFSFDKVPPDSWKWYTGNGQDNYQYTVWPVVSINGKWYAAGIVQMWQGRPNTGAFEMPTWHDDFHKNWCYDPNRWGQMYNYYPNPGDEFGFFVSAGNARGVGGVTSVRERSNVVKFQLPAGDTGNFTF